VTNDRFGSEFRAAAVPDRQWPLRGIPFFQIGLIGWPLSGRRHATFEHEADMSEI